MGALSVLSEISSNLDIRKHITDLGAVPLLVNLLSDPARYTNSTLQTLPHT